MASLWGCFDGLRGRELRLTRVDVGACSHQGDCLPEVRDTVRRPYIKAQLDTFTPDELRESLRECGGWEEEELTDDEANRERVLWVAACDANENRDRVD